MNEQQIVKMWRLSSFINDNYYSPDKMVIEQARRRREIEEIDELVKDKKRSLTIKMPAEINEQHRDSIDK
jgi:LPS O-antigen subunit length determinant protein (WzzB/FepE family)